MLTCDRKIKLGSGALAITFNDFTRRDKFFKCVNAGELVGNPSADSTRTPKQGAHGVTDSLSFYGDRVFPFIVECHAPTILERQQMERQIKQLLALPIIPDFSSNDGYMPMEIIEEDGTIMQTTVKIASDVSIEYIDTRDNVSVKQRARLVKFSMVSRQEFLTSPTLNEEMGGETFEGTNFEVAQGEEPMVPFELFQTIGASDIITNNGWYGAYPIITIYGPTTGPYLENVTTGGTVDLDGLVLASGEHAVVDFYAQTVKKNDGTDLSGYLTLSTNWWYLAPGDNEIRLRDDTGSSLTSSMKVEWRDTYI